MYEIKGTAVQLMYEITMPGEGEAAVDEGEGFDEGPVGGRGEQTIASGTAAPERKESAVSAASREFLGRPLRRDEGRRRWRPGESTWDGSGDERLGGE